MKRKFASALAVFLVIILCVAPTASAASIQASYYLTAYSAYLYSEGDGDISLWFEVQGTKTMDEIGALSIRLQEKPSGSTTWTTVKTYNYVDYPNLLGYDDNFYYSNIYYAGTEGSSYRAYVTVWAGLDGEGDSRVILTEAIIA